MFQLWIPPMGKPDKKAVFSAYCGDEATACAGRAFPFRRRGDGPSEEGWIVASHFPFSRRGDGASLEGCYKDRTNN